MRSQATAVRGWIALIRKGSGTVVGLARLVNCGTTLNQKQMLANSQRHCIPEDMIRRGEVEKWTAPWQLADVIPLEQPVPYEHRSGAVIWVTLTPDAQAELDPLIRARSSLSDKLDTPPSRSIDHIKKLSDRAFPERRKSASDPEDHMVQPRLSEGEFRELGRSVLSGGNIRNNHMKLASLLHAFPSDVIGGANKSKVAPRQLLVDWGGTEPVATDIDGSKSIFRSRGWVRRFFAASDAKENDVVVIFEIAPYRINVRLERRK